MPHLIMHWLAKESLLRDVILEWSEILLLIVTHMNISVHMLLLLYLVMHHISLRVILHPMLWHRKVIYWLPIKIRIIGTHRVLLMLPLLVVKLIVLILLLI